MAIIIPPIIDDSIVEVTEVKRIENLAQPIKQYTAEGVAVNLNVYTGKPTITHNDLCIGTGNYQIPVSHVYRDDLVGISAPVTIGFGDGWKLNLHQYVYPYQASYNYPRFSSGDYVYIDDVGYKHRFVKYKTEDGFDVYYDADGTGLRLKLLADSECEVYNDVTRLHFDASGRLDKIISPFNESLDKIIVYENNKLTKAYVVGKSSRQLQFTYNGNLLDEIKCAGHANTLKFTYDTTSLKLRSVDLVNGDTCKNIATYAYSGNKIALAYDSRKNQGVKLSYDTSSRVSSVKTGAVNDSKTDVGAQLSCDTYTYATGANKTEVTNEKSITLVYNFDLKGRACGTLEKETSGGLTNYRTLQKGTGWSLSADSTSTTGEKINGKTVSTGQGSIDIDGARVAAFRDIFGVDSEGKDKEHRHTDRFTLGFWLKPGSDYNTITANLHVNASDSANNTTHTVVLRDGKKDAWQYVTIPVYFDKNLTGTVLDKLIRIAVRKETMTGMSINFSSQFPVYVSDMRITVGAPAQIMVDGVEFKDQLIACSEDALDFIVLNDSFMTSSDLYTSYKNKYLALGYEFDLVYCNGTKVKQVYDFGFEKEAGVVVPFTTTMETDTNSNQIDTLNYVIQSKTRTAINKWNVSETRYKFYYIYDDRRSHYEQKQITGQVEGISASLPDSASYKYVQVYGNGLQREQRDENGLITKYTHDNYGNLEKTEAYFESAADGKKITTVYDYDAGHEYATYITVSDATQTPSKTTTYQLNYVDAPYINVAQIKTDYEVAENFTYSNDLTQLIKVNKTVEVETEDEQPDGGISEDFVGNGTQTVEILRNNLTYNGNSGRLNSVSDQGGRSYTFDYNEFGEPKEYSYNGIKAAESLIVRNNNNTTDDVITEKRCRAVTTDEVSTTLDKYGRVASIAEQGTQIVRYIYEDELEDRTFKESPYCAQIGKIIDGYSNETHTYRYDDKTGRLKEYTVKDNAENSKITVIEQPNKVDEITVNDETTKIIVKERNYTIAGGETRKVSLEYQNQVAANNGSYADRSEETIVLDGVASMLESYYTYDGSGRLAKVENRGGVGPGLAYSAFDTATQVTYTDRGKLAQINDKVYISGNPATYETTLSYNKNGNLAHTNLYTNLVIDSDGKHNIVENLYNKKTVVYGYDKSNRLIEEDNSALGEYTYTYDQSTGNLLSVNKIANDGTVETKTFTYSNGRRAALNGLTITYDKYGYVTQLPRPAPTTNTLLWNRRGQLASNHNQMTILNATSITGWNNYYNHQGMLYKKDQILSINNNPYSVNLTKTYQLEGNKILGEDWVYADTTKPTVKFRYLYDAQGVSAIVYKNRIYKLMRDPDGSVSRIFSDGTTICEYHYDAWGNCETQIGPLDEYWGERTDDRFVIANNPFRWKGFYYDADNAVYRINGRCYSPTLMQYLQPDLSTITPEKTNGLDLYCFANNNPVSVRIGGIVGGNSGDFSTFSSTFLPAVSWLAENATTIYGTAASLFAGIPVASYYYKYATAINSEFQLYGLSKWKTSSQLSNVSLKIGAVDGVLIGINTLIDMYDSYQRGVSTEGILLGGALTAASSVGMLYLNKGIMWSATTIGTAISPGLGTAIGFTVGIIASILTDIFFGRWIADLIDNYVK